MKTLILDATYYPVQFVDWKKAMVLFFNHRAEVVDFHEDIEIRSTYQSYKLPKVLRLFQKVKALTRVKFTRSNVFYRDKYQCQYCLLKLKETELTLDHVLPKSRGGGTTWENIATSCHKCNNKKGHHTPEEVGLRLHKKPIEPKWSPQYAFRLSRLDIDAFGHWFYQK